MKPVLLTDFGSTYTKLTAVDLDAAKLLGTAQAYTTVASDVRIGFQKALDALLAQTGPLTFAQSYACSSAAGGLRMMVSGLVPELRSKIVFEPEFRNADALRGIEGFSHLWLIWQFSAAVRDTWSPTVRPPRLGGNERVGVFATRSPFRPNAIGLSCVKLEGVRHEDGFGDVLIVAGADLMDGTPIYDIKPYLPYADAHPEALGGFAPSPKETIEVKSPPELLQKLPEGQREALLGVLAQDPRPQYQNDPERVYGMSFGGWDVKFRVKDGVLTVLSLAETEHQ